jgi:lysophospholipase L1-like esterase
MYPPLMQWYQEEIQRLEHLAVGGATQPKVVFYGSSTFTRWFNLGQDFPQVQAVNLGFGGSTLAACAWFFERVVPRQQPTALFVYAGDNDLGDGRTPEEVVLFFEQLLAVSNVHLGLIPLCFVSIKPSPARRYLHDNIRYANDCIRQRIAALGPPYYFLDLYPAMLDGQGQPQPALYDADGLHLSPAGYALWRQAIGWQLGQMGLLPA